ncbi:MULTISPECIES: c-type cytochrome [unclassified Bradyrhizobium]|uniref:c-type cytochrome n=1 Tax=unclassified Bradyrhizobium TaxID=2631580 RepID=UPI002916321D|nr:MULTISPECIES: c-type cytochrome [unclassified Bradyrhizobium]
MRAILLGLLLCTASAAHADPAEEIARGEMLATIGDCGGCHTTDSARPFAGGKRIETPFGTITAPNLTSDRDTGIGAWSDDDFRRALREGVAPNGARYYPVFPYPHFTKLVRNDILAIRSYLASLPAVSNKVASPELRFPYGYRPLLRLWNYVFLKPGLFEPDQGKSAEWNRGGYLVEGLGHCGACHTPKNLFGAEKRRAAYRGSRVAGWFAPRLDNAPRSGLKRWSVDDIVDYLKTGRNAKSHAAGPMAEVIARSTSKMEATDLRAIAVYLKELPAGSSEATISPPSDATMIAGQTVYARACISCHQADGTGAPGVTPPLPGNALLQSGDPLSTLRVVLDGTQNAVMTRAPNAPPMPAYARELTDQQIADVATYIRNAWGNAAPAVSADDVRRIRP